MVNQPLFHLAFPVVDLQQTRAFYVDVLGCTSGRESDRWIDFDFFGHQLVAHLVEPEDHPNIATNPVDGHAVPASHFGVILHWSDYEAFVARLRQAGRRDAGQRNFGHIRQRALRQARQARQRVQRATRWYAGNGCSQRATGGSGNRWHCSNGICCGSRRAHDRVTHH